jgi:hypothetical protein
MPQASPAAMIDPVEVPPIRSKYSQSRVFSPNRAVIKVSGLARIGG